MGTLLISSNLRLESLIQNPFRHRNGKHNISLDIATELCAISKVFISQSYSLQELRNVSTSAKFTFPCCKLSTVTYFKKLPWSKVWSVWLLFLLSDQGSFSISTKILISSGMASEGWVSFSWMATYKGKGEQHEGGQRPISGFLVLVHSSHTHQTSTYLSWNTLSTLQLCNFFKN